MKRWIALLLALCLPAAALTETAEVTANAVVKSRTTADITAPASGVLSPFHWESGDIAAQGDVLFELNPLRIYAPVDGVVRCVFAQAGEQAADVMSEYGMLMSIQKKRDQLVDASTAGAYKDEKNKRVHAGEVVYFEQTNARDNEGEGRIVSVNGSHYTIELLSGDFEDGDDVKVYRDDKMSSKNCIGSGEVCYAADVPVHGIGYVLRCAVQEGETVKQGDLLFELLNADADSTLHTSAIAAPQTGALEVLTAGGMQVYKGQVLATLHPLDVLSVVASVDEIDLGRVHVGDTLPITFDRYPDEVVMGSVTQIAALGIPKQNATYYDVTIDFYTTLDVLPRMNATVVLPALP